MKVNCKSSLHGWTAASGICLLLAFVVASAAMAAPLYPLKKSANGRYLVDQNNAPCLIMGDAPQALIANLSDADAQMFLTDRASNGFNTVWINLLCNTYTGGRADGSTFDGILPFTNTLASGSYNLTTPNEAYFARVDRALTLAAQQGLLVVLDPIETGGWLNTIVDNGFANCRAYGQYLGNRYKNFDNIIWINGNDYTSWTDTNVDAIVRTVALGIQDNDTRHIQTIELNYPVSGSLDDSAWAPVIQVNSSYTYSPTYGQVLVDYNRTNFLPDLMVEANYEFENAWTNNTSGRRQEYWTLLSGACGQLYGNHFTWPFLSGWQAHLDTDGSRQFGYVKALFEPRRWYDLVPDQHHTLVTAGSGTPITSGDVNGSDYATAARTADGALAIVYMPTTRTITVAMSQLIGPAVAQWYDPSSGLYTAIPGSPFANSGKQMFTPTGSNADGNGDWVLVLESAADITSPMLVITQPADFQVFSSSSINISGTASAGNGINSVTVNGLPATRVGSNWSAQVTLSVGTNSWTVIATDGSPTANTTTSVVHAIFQSPSSGFSLMSPENVTIGTDPGQCYASGVTLGSPVAFNNCGGDPVALNDAPSQFPTGTNTVIWTATDSCNNIAICSQLVIVVDEQPPTITQCAASVVGTADINGQAAVLSFTGAVVASDNCTSAGSLEITQDPAPGALVGAGTNTVTITVKDAAGNASQCTTSFIVTQSVGQVAIWEVAMSGAPRATCILTFDSDFTVSGYGIEQSFCGPFTVTGTWSQDAKGQVSGTFNKTFADPDCGSGAIVDGTFATKLGASPEARATARDSTRASHWKVVRSPSFPALSASWGGVLKVKKSSTPEIYNLSPSDAKPGLYDITGQSAAATYKLTGTLLVTSGNQVTAYIVRQLPSGSVASFYTGKVNLSKQTLKLAGKDATGAKHQLSATPQ